MSIALFAEDGYGTCRVPGSSDYIEVSVSISNGEMRISNASSRPVVSVFVSVTATEYCSKDKDGNVWSNPVLAASQVLPRLESDGSLLSRLRDISRWIHRNQNVRLLAIRIIY